MNSRRHFLAAGAALPLVAAAKSTRDAQAPRGLLSGKVAIVYGAGGDIGSGVARAFAAEGAHVCLVGITLSKVENLAREIAASGGSCEPARVDALDGDAVEKHLDDVVARNGHLDIAFNLISLGISQGTPLTGMHLDAFSRPIETAMRTQFITGTAAGRHMARQNGGVILALTAEVARKPQRNSGGFGVACAAIEGLCRQLAVELGPSNVRVVTLRSAGSPDAAGVAAAIAQHARAEGVSPEAFTAHIAETTMLKRMPSVAEVASAAVLMASDRASAVTAAVTNLTCGEIAD